MKIHVFLFSALFDGFQPAPVVAADAAVLVPDVVEVLDIKLATWFLSNGTTVFRM